MRRAVIDPPIDWDRLEYLFEELSALPAAERDEHLAQLHRVDAALALELGSLLSHRMQLEPFILRLSQSVMATAADLVSAEADVPGHERTLGTDADDWRGATLAQYQIEDRVGRGGMGVVYRAWDTRLNCRVALKFLAPHLATDRVACERFLREARAAAALEHPNICMVHEAGETPDGTLFIAMEYYDGETLKARLARGRLDIDAAVDIAAQVTRALRAVHARGIVHRDVKPANIFLVSDGAVKLLDFGVARLPDLTLTRGGFTPGTVAYMAPEQVRGERVDERTDLWSLGAVLYEMLTGARPFVGTTGAAVLRAIEADVPAPVSRTRDDLPASLDVVVGRLLSADRADRYDSAETLLNDLERVVRGEDVERPTGTRRAKA